METILKYIGDVADAWIKLEEKIGLKKIIFYILLGFLVSALLNFRTVVRNSIEFITELSEELHIEKMERRDQILSELYPILVDYRVSVGADRILYFEYHNTKENLVGIPFKYVDLVIQNTGYGITQAPEASFKEINVGTITNLYNDLKRGEVIYCYGAEDRTFINKYQGAWEIFSQSDGSKKLAFVSIPGVRQPIGLMVFEWVNEDGEINRTKFNQITSIYVSAINGLILSNR